MAGESGTCGFCGTGGGYLGDQGDERSRLLHSAVLTIDDKGERHYKRHPNAIPDSYNPGEPGQQIQWCGGCLRGLAHEYQRWSDHNISAAIIALQVWLELDAPHWSIWEADDSEKKILRKVVQDDTAIHMDKLWRERELRELEVERGRRNGWAAVTKDWSP